MGTGRDNLFYVILFECLDVCLSQGLIEVFVPYASGRVSAAAFFHTQDCKLDAEMAENLRHGQGNPFITIVIGTDATHKEKILEIFALIGWQVSEE